MATSVQIPGDGTVSRKWLIGGGAVVAGIVGWAYLRRARTPAAPTTPDEASLAPTELPPADLSGVSTGGGSSTTGLQFITTNDQWSADVVAKMVDLGYDSIAVSTALGKYLSSQTVTAQEAQYIYTAIALAGKPPVGTFSVRLEPTPTSTSGGTPTSGKHHYVVELHTPTVRTGVRSYVKTYSDRAVATANNVQVATVATMADPRNVKAGVATGFIAAKHPVYLHVVKAG